MTVQVGIVMGSESDLDKMRAAEAVLKDFGIESEIKILSAHRTPDLAAEFASSAKSRGIKVIIAGAGMANHLAGAMAAHSILPVIGVPLDGSPLNGFDALLATVQMPPGVPVATVAVGKAGAKNAGYLAAQIIALSDESIAQKVVDYRLGVKESMIEKNKSL